MTPAEQEAAQSADLAPWNRMLSYVRSSGVSPEKVCELVGQWLMKERGVEDQNLTMRCRKVWPKSVVIAFNSKILLKRPGEPDVNLGPDFRFAIRSLNDMIGQHRLETGK